MKKITFTLFLLSLLISANAQTWNWTVGNGANNSRYSYAQCVLGPDTKDNILWDYATVSSYWPHQVVTIGDTLVTDRTFDIGDTHHGTYIVAYDITDGTELWTADLPVDFPNDDWRNRVCGINDSLVFATRSGNTNASYLYALDIEDGSIVWKSDDLTDMSSTEGVVYAENGDIIAGNYQNITRFNVNDGSTVWESPRSSPSSGGSQVVRYNDKIYGWISAYGGPKIAVYNADNGDFLYESRVVGGGIVQQIPPFVGPDGTVYAPRAANNAATDTIVAFTDTGSELKEAWKHKMGYIPFGTHGVGPDGSVYIYSPNYEILRVLEGKNITSKSKPVFDNNKSYQTVNFNNIKQAVVSENTETVKIKYFPNKDVTPVDTSISIEDPNAVANSPYVAIDEAGNLFVACENEVFSFDYQLNTTWTEEVTDVGYLALSKNGNLIVPAENNVIKVYEGRGNICTGPQLDYTIPENFATEVPLNSEVSATFDVELTEEDLSGVTITPDPGNINASVSGYTVTISHDDFDSNTEYTATIPEGAVSDGTSLLIYDVVWSFTTIEETYSVTFSVTDGTNPIENANVQVPDLSVDDYTDANGELIIQDVAAGSYDYTVSATDYVSFSDNFEVIDENIIVDVVLEPLKINNFNENIIIYPNPNTGIFKINVKQKYELEIFDISGKIIYSDILNNNENIIDLKKEKPGIYLIKLFNENNLINTKILIK